MKKLVMWAALAVSLLNWDLGLQLMEYASSPAPRTSPYVPRHSRHVAPRS